MRERQKKCGVEWKEVKAASKAEKGTTWPKYWSACNKRLKEADAKKGLTPSRQAVSAAC